MGVSLKASARRWALDQFAPWNATTDAFDLVNTLQGRLFRADRFTTIYHRPTRRSWVSWWEATYPSSGVVKRVGTDEIYLVSETLRDEVLQGKETYDLLRQTHLVTPPSGGLGAFYQVVTLGTGEALGVVTKAAPVPIYADLELQGVTAADETEDVTVSRFLLVHSRNVSPQPGDYFVWNARWFLVNSAYIDGGLSVSRTSELVYGYRDMTYLRRTTGGGYNPVTGTVTASSTQAAFSALIGNETQTGPATGTAAHTLELYVYERHLGFAPRAGDSVIHAGQTFAVQSVVMRREELQWKLVVVR